MFKLEDPAGTERPPQSATRLKKACLVRIYPAGLSESHLDLGTERVVIGRSEGCDLELDDEHTSRQHAIIEVIGTEHFITDNASTNGTYVNDQQIDAHALKSGDQIRIGHHIFKYLSSDHIEAMYHEAVFQMMTIDGLTQAYNRRYFEDAFEREVQRSVRHARNIGLLIFDIDLFKKLNDEYGHLVGDDILAAFSKRIIKRKRSDELFARIGGEEFALVLAEISRDQMRSVAESMRKLVAEQPYHSGSLAISITVSIGAAHTNGLDPINTKDLWNQADLKLYEAKRAGRNRVCM